MSVILGANGSPAGGDPFSILVIDGDLQSPAGPFIALSRNQLALKNWIAKVGSTLEQKLDALHEDLEALKGGVNTLLRSKGYLTLEEIALNKARCDAEKSTPDLNDPRR